MTKSIENKILKEKKNWIIKLCYELCLTCTGKGTENENKRIKSLDGLVLYKENCYENDFLISFNNECLEECPEPYFIYTRTCV